MTFLIGFWSNLGAFWAQLGRQHGFVNFARGVFEGVMVPLEAKLAPRPPSRGSQERPKRLQEASRDAKDNLQDGF